MLKLRARHLQALPDIDNDVVDVALNHITSLSPSTSLRHLDVSLNLLTTTGNISLPNLIQLNVAGNFLTSIDADLPRLVHLDASSNDLTGKLSLPLIPSLTSLNIASNSVDILDLPVTIVELVADRNRLVSIPNLPLLSSLSLSENNIASLDEVVITLQMMNSLTSLNLYGNPIGDDDRYRMAVISAASALTMLDEGVLGCEVHEWVDHQRMVDDLVAEFGARQERVMDCHRAVVADLRQREREADRAMNGTIEAMDIELRETIALLQGRAMVGDGEVMANNAANRDEEAKIGDQGATSGGNTYRVGDVL